MSQPNMNSRNRAEDAGLRAAVSRRTFMQLAMGATGLALAACAPAVPGAAPAAESGAAAPARESVTVLWWRSQGGAIGDMLDQFAADFTDMDNDIVIQSEYQGGYVEHMNKIIASAAANALPDMTLLGDGQYPPLARNDILLPLNDLIDMSESFDITEYKEPINRGVLDGQMYQLAWGVSTPIFYINRDALDAAGLDGVPDTWEEAFSTYFPALTEADRVAFGYSAGNWWQQSAVWSAGAMVEDENWEIDLAHPAVIEWFERMQLARQNGEAHVPTSADGGASAYFGSGRAAMTIESTGLIGQVDSISEGSFVAEVGFLPSGPGGRWVPSGGNGLSILHNVDGATRDAAWQFIEYLHSPQPYADYVELTGYIPISDTVETMLADLMEADPRRQVAVDQFEFSRWHMKIHTVARASQEMRDAWDECITTDVDVAQRLARLQETVVEIAQEEGFEPTLPA